ncbi:hypothetical protein VNO77_05880 [Canavalia gladiata]|uniref:Adenosine deaminase domain-containing protein n=1 Tax=Canavalia gladiata TaxID=3824 RepID=A0AAN9N4D1_CANGL
MEKCLFSMPKYADGGMSKRSYIEAVVEGIRAVSSVDVAFEPGRKLSNPSRSGTKYSGNTRKKIFVRLILSIERRETTAMAMETVMLAIEMRRFGIVGISLHGNPFTGQWDTYLPALEFARACGLYVPKSKEIHDMLDFVPHRIGHACYFDEEHRRKLKSSNIPVEICLTSNIETRSVSSIYRHHFVDLYEAKHPIALCTDQPGVFDTSLTEEYMIAASTFGLGRKEMLELSKNAVEFIFADNVGSPTAWVRPLSLSICAKLDHMPVPCAGLSPWHLRSEICRTINLHSAFNNDRIRIRMLQRRGHPFNDAMA